MVAQMIICLQYRRPRFDPWIGKILWRRKWPPTPVFFPGEFHGQQGAWWATVRGVATSWIRLSDWHTQWWWKDGGFCAVRRFRESFLVHSKETRSIHNLFPLSPPAFCLLPFQELVNCSNSVWGIFSIQFWTTFLVVGITRWSLGYSCQW